MSSLDKTMYFNFEDNNQKDVRETLETVYDALEKKGIRPDQSDRRLSSFG